MNGTILGIVDKQIVYQNNRTIALKVVTLRNKK